MEQRKHRKLIKVSDIPPTWLSPECQILIADYCYAAKKLDNINFDPSGERVLCNIMCHCAKTQNPILRALCRDLKARVRGILAQPDKRATVSRMLVQVA